MIGTLDRKLLSYNVLQNVTPMPIPVDRSSDFAADEPDYNQLHTLGNRAIALGLLIGHGYRDGQYELLHRDEVVLLPPEAAISYLRTLIQTAEAANG